MKKIIAHKILWSLFGLFFAGCSLSPNNKVTDEEIAAVMAQSAQTAIAQFTQTASTTASLTPVATATSTATITDMPTRTFTPSPTITETPTEIPSEMPTSTPPTYGFIPEDAIIYYMVALDTGGSIGCGDSLVKITTGQTRTGNLAADLKVALDSIFSAGQYLGTLYNATYPSSLKVKEVDLQGDGTAVVQLDGYYEKPANSCDASRYREQVWVTARQFKEIVRFQPYAGNALLGDRLSIYSDGGK